MSGCPVQRWVQRGDADGGQAELQAALLAEQLELPQPLAGEGQRRPGGPAPQGRREPENDTTTEIFLTTRGGVGTRPPTHARIPFGGGGLWGTTFAQFCGPALRFNGSQASNLLCCDQAYKKGLGGRLNFSVEKPCHMGVILVIFGRFWANQQLLLTS